MGCEAQLALKCLLTPTLCSFFLGWGIFCSEVGHADLVFGVPSLGGLDNACKIASFMRVVVTICATLVDPKLNFYMLTPVIL